MKNPYKDIYNTYDLSEGPIFPACLEAQAQVNLYSAIGLVTYDRLRRQVTQHIRATLYEAR